MLAEVSEGDECGIRPCGPLPTRRRSGWAERSGAPLPWCVRSAAAARRAPAALEPKTLDLYDAGWRLRVVPVVGHLPLTMVTGGVADRAVAQWVTNGNSKSLVRMRLPLGGG
ncbi:hypothetical protein GCM10023319_74480 [Nocardia iowensis]